MKKNRTFFLVIALLVLAGAVLFAFVLRRACEHRPSDEEEGLALKAEMFQKYENAFNRLNEAETQIDMNLASGEIRSAVEPYLALAAEYRLQHAGTREERIRVLKRLIETAQSLQKIDDRPLEGTGSMEPLLRNTEAASAIGGQARTWFIGETLATGPDQP